MAKTLSMIAQIVTQSNSKYTTKCLMGEVYNKIVKTIPGDWTNMTCK